MSGNDQNLVASISLDGANGYGDVDTDDISIKSFTDSDVSSSEEETPKVNYLLSDTMLSSSSNLKSFQNHLIFSKRIIALVGAGLSASSGLPTFRGSGGMWRNYDAIDLATPEAFRANPSLVWQFYSARRSAALKARPNAGHYSLAELARIKNGDFLTLTQNVDGLSLRANHPSETLLDLHGNLFEVRCTGFLCNYTQMVFKQPLVPALADNDFPLISADIDDATVSTVDNKGYIDEKIKNIPLKELPICPKCKKDLLRPGIVWFGEPLPLKVIDTADNFLVQEKVDLILVIGTSCSVWPAAGYVDRVKSKGGKVAVFNIEADKEDVEHDGGWVFKGDAAKWLPIALEPVIGRNFIPRRCR